MPQGQLPDPGEASGSQPIRDVRDWLSYYSECRQYELVMGQKFTTLLGQASVFAFAAGTGILALADRLAVVSPGDLFFGAALAISLGLLMYAAIILKYFLQIRFTGGIMLEIEEKILGEDANRLGVIHVLRD